jgi:hypothetical protein
VFIQEFVETLCPYCGEPIQLLIDCSIPEQDYIEDCQVCCRPIQVVALTDLEGIPSITVTAENE